MAVSSSTPQLEETWIAVQFQLAGLTTEFEGDIPDVVRHALDDAYAAINGEYRNLPSMYPDDGEVEAPAYDVCEIDEALLESDGRLVVAISFASGGDFTQEAIGELKALCCEKFAEAAAVHGIACVFTGIERWRRLTYVEHEVVEAVEAH
ncbi:hypothetical protein WKR88_16055 [Trinickia caryophylli]|uniref:Uncharacterized protein n=1 Tax=Trinickia caryophylli TaxID=28094 RepID=A0A1X7FP31_TRICW|nr:hypothetical protein [Trinickia caryophylli]PMS08607.1 hypothetical protein C0Z17_29375 [Trinickia caryophylli]TRX14409.1 hypothetical protein FNF07_24360 [Trinickia caryophylli]WQE14245.1 hypothetical protein U0034_26550 [Trinickia caryophylli]SMF56039.1 hypothetical protein SAMN06295900_110109 [Trinickia caryophylli]GLU33244.1 hypothetical protein Busp01_30860 [Trinickia caryophylli]